MTEIVMPALSESMEQGTILRWLKREGEPVAVGEELVEIETDKATIAYQSEAQGTLTIVVDEGMTVPVGAVIASLAPTAGTPSIRSSIEVELPDPRGDAAVPDESSPMARATRGDNGADHAPARAHVTTALLATPLARRAAELHDVALDGVHGTGPRGRITRRDVLIAAGVEQSTLETAIREPRVESRPATTGPARTAGQAGVAATEDEHVHQPTRVQQLIARRMAEARATIPEFEVEVEAAVDDVLSLRGQLKQVADGDAVPSLNDFVIKACAIALRRHPRLNASYRDGRFHLQRRINVGFAVAAGEALIVPTVFAADVKSVHAIAMETRALAQRVREQQVTPAELAGGTFTVSNLGMFGMTAIRPVINPPQAAILGVGAIRSVLARVEGQIVDRAVMTLTLSADHRIIYGAHAARFLLEIQGLLATPLRLAL